MRALQLLNEIVFLGKRKFLELGARELFEGDTHEFCRPSYSPQLPLGQYVDEESGFEFAGKRCYEKLREL